MAEYGAELRDSEGRRFARVDGGLSYHYWGKVTITPTNMNNWFTSPLFNIPSTVKISAFIFCDFGGNEQFAARYGKAEVRQASGRWIARVSKSFAGSVQPALVSATFYIFVPAAYIASQAYGLQCFSETGVKVYDSARPLLQICGVGSGGTGPGGTSNFFNRTPAKCGAAYTARFGTHFIVVSGSPYYAETYYYGTTTGGTLAGYTGMISLLDTVAASNTQTYNIPLIDAGYYDQFPNLGNM